MKGIETLFVIPNPCERGKIIRKTNPLTGVSSAFVLAERVHVGPPRRNEACLQYAEIYQTAASCCDELIRLR